MANSALNLPTENMFIGGNFDTNPWQRGTTFAGVAANTYTADRIQQSFVGAGGGQFTVRRTANAPTVAQAGMLATNCYEALTTTADVAIAAGDGYWIQHAIEGYNWAQLAQRPFTISFWARSNVIGIYCVSFVNGGGDRSYVAEYTIVAADTWEYKTVTVPASPSAGTWNYTNTAGIFVNFALAMGATFQTPANVWTVGNFLASANQVNNVAANNNYLMIDLIQVIEGEQAKSFQRRTFCEELVLCQRYYQKSFAIGTVPAQAAGGGTGESTQAVGSPGATNNSMHIEFQTPMRATPVITTYSPGAASAQVYNLTQFAVHTATAVVVGNEKRFYVNSAGNAAGVVTSVQGIHWTAQAEL